MNELPAMHLINLDRSTGRLLRFKQRNPHLQNVVRVSATDGAKLDREALIRSGYINADLPYPAGTLGCAVSHLKLWEMAASQGRSITIFEDDIAVSYQFHERAREVLSVLPEDWDIVQWGYIFNPLFTWVDLGTSKACLRCYGARNYDGTAGLEKYQAEIFSVAPIRLLHSFGMQGYSISAKGAGAALEFCLPLRKRLIQFPEAGVAVDDVGIDCTLCGLYSMLNAFICIPQLLITSNEEGSSRKTIDKELAGSSH